MEGNYKGYKGLSSAEVAESRERHGRNVLTPPQKEPLWRLFLHKFEDPIIRILLIAAFLSLGISFIHGEFIETIGIFFAIFLATGVGFWFEMDANKKFDILNKVNDETPVKVLRDGIIKEIPKSEVVCGDLVMLDTGEEIPADGELAEAISLSVNESTLTGEPVISKSTNSAEFDHEATYPSNRVYRGTTVVEGHCSFVVTDVGDSTEFGKVAEKSAEKSTEQTPLNKQLESLAGFIGFAGLLTAFLLFSLLYIQETLNPESAFTTSQIILITSSIAGFLAAIGKIWMPILNFSSKKKNEERGWLFWLLCGVLIFSLPTITGELLGFNIFSADALISLDVASRILGHFMVAVTLIVVAVPEGLPMAVTLSLAMSMRRMLLTNNLVRKMHATETMGAATVICTDKTGTLTMNQMRVAEALFRDDSSLVYESISLNSTAFLDFSAGGVPKALGNPTEAALLLWLYEKGEDYLEIRKSAVVESQLTFSTERKYMATLANSPALGKRVLYVKGAPEIVAGKCKDVPEYIPGKLLDFQNRAMRTLGFAYCEIDPSDSRSIGEMTSGGLNFLGAVAISDPVRSDVPAAVMKCRDAGIDVKIVTGDTPATATEIGRQIGILGRDDNDISKYVITGSDFAALSDEDAYNIVKDLRIMCRARPGDKQRLVELLQKRGEVVAVTGDGTNDAPALNHAHVGLSMGSGTSVAKEASDITLLDDSFNSIATAVMWGRSLYQNIQRFIIFQLTINLTAMIIVLLGTLLGHELPLTVTQMLWVNLIMDTFAAGALASLPPEERVMKLPPRDSAAFIITRSMSVNIIFTGLLFVVSLLWLILQMGGESGEISRYNLSMFFTIFVMLQFWNMFNAKSFNSAGSAFRGLIKSPGFLLVSLLIVVGQILIVQFGGDVFRTVPLKFWDWAMIIAGTSVVLWIGELIRFLKK
ncbi:calcium-translocating P-type ATPase, PMCA-type [Bacteroidales bacterium]